MRLWHYKLLPYLPDAQIRERIEYLESIKEIIDNLVKEMVGEQG
jgi:hypothetical protein